MINLIITITAISVLLITISLMIQLGVVFGENETGKPECLDSTNSTKYCYCDQLKQALEYLGRGQDYK